MGLAPVSSQLQLIRYSHIFASAVREVLELSLLRELGAAPITPRQLQILRFIDTAHHHIDDVAKFLEVTGPAATQALDRLERLGLVIRTPSGDDRRLKFLSCSEKGKKLIESYGSLETERVDAILSRFSSSEVSVMAGLLERFSLALIDSGGSEAAPCLRCHGYFEANCPVQFVNSRCPYRHEERV
ncbi:MAG: MarR family winged helix-turn-helix transcriptional regulator [Thermoanaerobaculia bacterium]